MDPATIEREIDEYIEYFRPKPFSSIENFMVKQKVILFYRQALANFEGKKFANENLSIKNKEGIVTTYSYNYVSDIKIGKMYVTKKNIIFVINPKYKEYYENYTAKTSNFPKFNMKMWSQIRFMLPNVVKHYEDIDENSIIVLEKPYSSIYPLRDILDHFDGCLMASV